MDTKYGKDTLVFFVNGKKVTEISPDPETSLLEYLRQQLHLSGTKLGCGEGGCGACTVMVSKYDRENKAVLHFSVNACLAPVCSMHGLAVTTVEGIGSTKTRLHPVQERLAKSHGSQCGFCTPGIIMSMYTLLRNNPQPSCASVESAFQGNLCRCTGYRPILEGFKTFTTDQCGLGERCCQNQLSGLSNDDCATSSKLVLDSDFLPYDPSQEPIFPPELLLTDKYESESLTFYGERSTWYRPVTLDELLELKHTYPSAKLVVGNTRIGVEMKKKNHHYPVLISPVIVSELNCVTHDENGIHVGANTTLAQLEKVLGTACNHLEEWKSRTFLAIIEMLRWFAGHQIRNVSAIAGNIMTASPISDLNTLFMAAGCSLTVISKEGGKRVIQMDSKFFVGYRTTVVKADEVMISLFIPFTRKFEFFHGYKQAQRRENDVAIVNAAMRVLCEEGTNVVREASFAFGGMAPYTVMATKTAESLVGQKWTDQLVGHVCTWLAEDLPLPAGAPGGMTEYRRTLAASLFFKFFLTVQLEMSRYLDDDVKPLSSFKSATSTFVRGTSKGSQVFEEPSSGLSTSDSVGKPVPHACAERHVTGEAIYCDDIPKMEGELYLALVLSTRPLARIVDIDTQEALAMPGVHTFVCHQDVPGSNKYGPMVKDEDIFAEDMVTCMGQIIGAIVADTQTHAQRAAHAVKIQYQDLEDGTPIITIEQAIEAKSFYEPSLTLKSGDVLNGFHQADYTMEGEVRLQGQEHFYLETQACIVVPKEEDEMEVYCSTQSPSDAQEAIAEALAIPSNRIVVKVKRMGGAFGGKQTRYLPLLLATTVAANKLQSPVRCMLDRDEDMALSGGRHPFFAKYKVGFTDMGKIIALDVTLYCNGGNSVDVSTAVLQLAILNIDSAYKIPNVHVKGFVCKTNVASNTAFRGFGSPQGIFVCESIMSNVALKLGLPPEQVRYSNLYREGDLTHFNQPFLGCNLERCWQQCIEESSYEKRRCEVDIFNGENRWRKRGLAIVPVKYGMGLYPLFMNQAGALVHVYKDGSVLISHAGTEMGQGLHTKMMQVASRALNLPISSIYIAETSTDKVPNIIETAGSIGSDLNGIAVLNACHIIMQRLKPYIAANSSGSWKDWVTAAYFDRVSLSSTGFYKTPNIGYDFETNTGCPYAYFTQGVACSEVEIDCLTGDHHVIRTDIVMDVGKSLNPAIDIGQIEGGFVQGYGLFTLEQPKYSPTGYLYTRGPGTYKIPSVTDIPIEFNVRLLKDSPNPTAVYSSKGTGEPPLFLATSVFFAIKEAIHSARADAGVQGLFQIDSPATAEKIRMACEDRFTKMFPPADRGTYTPWIVDL